MKYFQSSTKSTSTGWLYLREGMGPEELNALKSKGISKLLVMTVLK